MVGAQRHLEANCVPGSPTLQSSLSLDLELAAGEVRGEGQRVGRDDGPTLRDFRIGARALSEVRGGSLRSGPAGCAEAFLPAPRVPPSSRRSPTAVTRLAGFSFLKPRRARTSNQHLHFTGGKKVQRKQMIHSS